MWWMYYLRGDTVGTTPAQWEGPKYILKKTFTSDELAARDGYTVEEECYVLGDERILRKKDYFIVNITTRTYQRGWMRLQIKIPIVYGEPWREKLKHEIEQELRSNYDLIGVFLSEVDQQWCRRFELSWEENHG